MVGVSSARADVALQLGIEGFRWREYEANGSRILEEHGPRLRLGGEWTLPIDESYLARFRGSLYGGRVEYDGQACQLGGSCSPYKSDTDYVGSNLEATLVRHFGKTDGAEIFASGGVDNWRREIKGSATVQGVVEDWTVFYLAAGAGHHWASPGARYHVRLGVKYPFYTYELPDLYDVTLEPEGALSLFFNTAVEATKNGRPTWGVGAYYDSYRFEESDTKRQGAVIVWQPESRHDVIGVYGVVYLQ